MNQKRMFRQRGSALILTVMMMMALGLMGLNMVNQHLNAALALTRSEKEYRQSWERAVSSLNWGLSRKWALLPTEGWQCAASDSEHPDLQTPGLVEKLKSCIKNADLPDQYVLLGEGKNRADSMPVYLYQLVNRREINASESRLKALQNGWLDFCPLKDERRCHETE